MCVICASAAGVRQPDISEIVEMFQANPHGAGYMVARDGRVEIHKGYMALEEFLEAIDEEAFTPEDPVVYHFRISTQAGTGPEMTHPFPLTKYIGQCKSLDCVANIGVAHNGIIQLTTDRLDLEYSDTAHYIAEFLAYLVRSPKDLQDRRILDAVYRTAKSKFTLMDGAGNIATVGDWHTDPDGLMFSNQLFRDCYFPGTRWVTLR